MKTCLRIALAFIACLALSASWAGETWGNVGAGATDAGNPVKIGGKYNATPPALTDGQRGDLQLDATGNVYTAVYPAGATALSASSGNVANASAAATLAGAASKTTYITGFAVTAGGATAAALVDVTVTGLIGGTATFTFAAPAGATLGATPLVVTFPRPVPASAANTGIVVTLPALGAGNTKATANAFGFRL